MKKILLIFLFAITTGVASAQKINVDSLIQVAIAHTNATSYTANQNQDSLFRAFTLAKAGSLRTALIYKLINYGQPTSKIGLTNHYKILNWAHKNNDAISESIITGELAFELSQNGDVPEGIKLGQSALKIAEKTGDNEAIGIVYDNLACCYSSSDGCLHDQQK